MKVYTVFNVKGGTGKTTFNVLLASYLQYEKGEETMLIDLDAPLFNANHIRNTELSRTSSDDNAYRVESLKIKDKSDALQIARNLERLAGSVRNVVIDFPGSLESDDAIVAFLRQKVIDKVIIPIETDSMILGASLALANTLRRMKQDVCIFLNKVSHKEQQGLYADAVAEFEKDGFKVSPHRVMNTVRFKRNKGEFKFLRSSVCFPKKQILKNSPGLIDLFEEITSV